MIIDNIYRRPNVLEILQKCKTFTRWRMTDEVKEILSDIKEPKKAPVKEKKVGLTNEYSYIEIDIKKLIFLYTRSTANGRYGRKNINW